MIPVEIKKAGPPPEEVQTLVTVKTQTTKEEHFVDDISYGDMWISLVMENGNVRMEYNVSWVESIEVRLI